MEVEQQGCQELPASYHQTEPVTALSAAQAPSIEYARDGILDVQSLCPNSKQCSLPINGTSRTGALKHIGQLCPCSSIVRLLATTMVLIMARCTSLCLCCEHEWRTKWNQQNQLSFSIKDQNFQRVIPSQRCRNSEVCFLRKQGLPLPIEV